MNHPLKKPLIGLLLSIVIAVFPLILVWFVDLIANFNGCSVKEGMVQPCIVAGVDIGGMLYSIVMSGWYLFITFPVAAGLFFSSLFWLARSINQMTSNS